MFVSMIKVFWDASKYMQQTYINSKRQTKMLAGLRLKQIQTLTILNCLYMTFDTGSDFLTLALTTCAIMLPTVAIPMMVL